MKKKILIHSIVFSPDGVSTAYLYNDIARNFDESGYEVVVLTTTPHYNIVGMALEKQPLTAKFGGLFYESKFNDIRVIHVPQKKYKSSLLRIAGFLYWHFLSLVLALMQRNISVILSPSPPLSIGIINLVIGWIKNARVIYNVQEIYPDLLINQGSLTFRPLVSLLKSMEKIVYNYSSAVTTIDSVFYDTIKSRFNDKSKLCIIPNFVDTSIFKPLPVIKCKLDHNKFPENTSALKLMYAGNIGHAQDWRPLIEVAKQLVTEDVEFWVIGEGVMKDFLEKEIQLHHLKIHLINYQPREKMPELIAYADIHFIFMSPEMAGQGFPSKVYTIMACAKPLLVASGINTPIHHFLTETKSGYLVDEVDFEKKCYKIAQFLRQAIENRSLISGIGLAGLGVIQKEYTKKAVADKYITLVDKLLSK